MPETIPALLSAAVEGHATQPLITWYDDRTGERTELSGATLGNWVAKTANLLVDGYGLGPGDRVAVVLPSHWLSAAILLGCWSAGVTVQRSAPTAPVAALFAAAEGADAPPGSPAGERFAPLAGSPAGERFAPLAGSPAGERFAPLAGSPAGERFAVSLAPFAPPLRVVPAGFVDFTVEVRAHGDRFTPYAPVAPEDPALADGAATLTHAELCRLAGARAAELGIGPADRVLIDDATHPDPVEWLLSPLAAGASVVLCGHLDPARLAGRRDAERVTVQLVSPADAAR